MAAKHQKENLSSSSGRRSRADAGLATQNKETRKRDRGISLDDAWYARRAAELHDFLRATHSVDAAQLQSYESLPAQHRFEGLHDLLWRLDGTRERDASRKLDEETHERYLAELRAQFGDDIDGRELHDAADRLSALLTAARRAEMGVRSKVAALVRRQAQELSRLLATTLPGSSRSYDDVQKELGDELRARRQTLEPLAPTLADALRALQRAYQAVTEEVARIELDMETAPASMSAPPRRGPARHVLEMRHIAAAQVAEWVAKRSPSGRPEWEAVAKILLVYGWPLKQGRGDTLRVIGERLRKGAATASTEANHTSPRKPFHAR